MAVLLHQIKIRLRVILNVLVPFSKPHATDYLAAAPA
jgi:hypothetical protein